MNDLLGKYIKFADGCTLIINKDRLDGLYLNDDGRYWIEDKFGFEKEWVEIVDESSGKTIRDNLFSPLCGLVIE